MANLSEYYDGDYHVKRHASLLRDTEYFWARSEAAKRLYFGRFSQPYGRVLEYGCGMGQNIALLKDAVGYDCAEIALTACRNKGIATYTQEKDIPLNAFEFVLCRHVLEHVEDPLQVLRRLLSFLTGNGTLILVLPREDQKNSPLTPDLDQHLFCWNFRAINNLVFRAGGIPISEGVEYVVGYRALLWVRRAFGASAYYYTTLVAGRAFRIGELVIHCRRK